MNHDHSRIWYVYTRNNLFLAWAWYIHGRLPAILSHIFESDSREVLNILELQLYSGRHTKHHILMDKVLTTIARCEGMVSPHGMDLADSRAGSLFHKGHSNTMLSRSTSSRGEAAIGMLLMPEMNPKRLPHLGLLESSLHKQPSKP